MNGQMNQNNMKAIKRYLKQIDSVDILAIFAICLYTTILLFTITEWI
jgi:hypothetical protein